MARHNGNTRRNARRPQGPSDITERKLRRAERIAVKATTKPHKPNRTADQYADLNQR